MSSVRDINQKFEQEKNNYLELYNRYLKKIETLEDNVMFFSSSNFMYDNNENVKEMLMNKIKYYKGMLDFIRPVTEEDIIERNDIFLNYADKVKNVIPDDIPYAFHGNSKIFSVIEIIETGGLYTPKERNSSYNSFTSQIDVTCKDNINASIKFADPGIKSFLPYGAIFVVLPREEEIKKVLETKENAEVNGGISRVSFKDNPDRLINIITTTENKKLLQKVLIENNLNEEKVVTHDEFIELCREKFKKLNLRNGK